MSADNFYICVFNEETNLLSFPYHVDEKDETPSPHPLGKGLSEYVLQTKKNAIITEELDKQLQAEGKVELSGEYTKIWVGIYLNFESNMKGVLVIQDYNDENAYGNEELEVLEYVSEQIVRAIDKKYTDEKLFLSEQRLLKSNMDKDKFFSIISHDLKSPFQGIMGMAELLNEDYALLEESEKQESLYLMDKSIKNVYALIEDLLEWARLQSGKMEFEPTNVDLKDVILKAISIAQITANNKNIVIKNEINSNSNVFVDKNMITTVIRNLLANAIKFSKECSEIIITSKNVDDKALLSITDSGIGMNENTINKLFKIDEHYTSIGTNGEKGTGLGLILCKELIEINRGSIWAESEFGKGSTFSFTMPLE
jgi:signal transduction histidine kinase